MIDDTHGLKINRMAVSPNGTRIAIQFEGFAHFVVMRGDRATGRDCGDFDTLTQHVTVDQLKEWTQVSLGWLEGKVVQTVSFHEPVEPHVEALREDTPAPIETPVPDTDTFTVMFQRGDDPQLWYVDGAGADRLDAGLLLETGPGSFNERVASPRRLAIIGALIGVATKRLNRKAEEGNRK